MNIAVAYSRDTYHRNSDLIDPVMYFACCRVVEMGRTVKRATKRPRRLRTCHFTLVRDANIKMDSYSRRIHSQFILLLIICEHLTFNNLLNPHQSAYIKHHSTDTALLYIHDHLISAIGSQKVSCLCLLDFSAAFDTVLFCLCPFFANRHLQRMSWIGRFCTEFDHKGQRIRN